MSNIEKAVILKRALDDLRPLTKETEQRIMQKFRLDWNYHSNHLEGNTLTYGETKALLLFGITAQGKTLKEHFEITGHNEAIHWVLEIIEQNRPLTETFIREINQLILKESYEVDAITPEGLPTKKKIQVGVYKSSPNHVKTKTGEIFRFASPEETPALMDDLLRWYRDKIEQENKNFILIAAEFHYKFIRIHPFDDGNGRTARILMNFILMLGGFPPAIIRTEDKQQYLSVLQQADAGQISAFIDFIALNVVKSLDLMLKGAKGESIEEADDIDKEISLLEQRLKTRVGRAEMGKTLEGLFEIYDKSVTPTFEKFLQKGALMEKFYIHHSCQLRKGGNILSDDKAQFSSIGRNNLTDDIITIAIEFLYEGLKAAPFKNLVYRSSITFHFNAAHYTVFNSGNYSIHKLYNENLSDIESTSLINDEIKRQTAFIEEKIN